MDLSTYRMPGEFEPHHGCLMIWPTRQGSWPFDGKAAKERFTLIATTIQKSEQVYMLVEEKFLEEAKSYLPSSIHIIPLETNDAWARDTGPTFIQNENGEIAGIDWCFNAWGGSYDGLYAHWEEDDKVAATFSRLLGVPCIDAHPFVLEGGSIHSDGEGTLLVTESCLLSQGRNPQLSKEEIEDKLKSYLGIQKVLWLPFGIYQDETNEHIDNVCAFVKPGEVVLAWTDDEDDPQYPMSKADLDYLEKEVDAKGRKIKVHKLPIPKNPLCIQAGDLAGYVYEEGEATRDEGERLAGSYVNFYISNGHILLPQFNDPNDEVALNLMKALFPEREIACISARDILLGGGNIHCITQQIPKGINIQYSRKEG